jgi:starch synthase
MNSEKIVKILFAASEMYPLIKTGGLADVAGALPDALLNAGAEVRVVLPSYRGVVEQLDSVEELISLGDIGLSPAVGEVKVLQGTLSSLKTIIWLIDCPAMFERDGGPYQDENGEDWEDNMLRFALFSKAIAMLGVMGEQSGWQPDIIHLNDWQTGMVAAWLHSWNVQQPKTVFTIHNLQYQGVFPAESLARIGLPQELYSIDGLEYYGQISFLKAGLYYANQITAVSPSYAQEIQSAEMGMGLEGLLRSRRESLCGILNGVDSVQWNPATDRVLHTNYSKNSLAKRLQNRNELKARIGLRDGQGPLFGLVSRLTSQKGIDLFVEAAPALLNAGAQFAVLGSGDSDLESALLQLAREWQGEFAVEIDYDESLAHLFMAGSDLLLVPSRFEPCGLTQLYALRYGALPLVRRTGGLADTVDKQSGFLFENIDSGELQECMFTALNSYRDSLQSGSGEWEQRQQYAMEQEFGWGKSAQNYIECYRALGADLIE